MARPMVHLEKIDKSYVVGRNRLHVLKSVDLAIEGGEMVSIMGASGSGKSTLMNILGLLDGYDGGTYHLDGQLVKDLSETKAAGSARNCSYVSASTDSAPKSFR